MIGVGVDFVDVGVDIIRERMEEENLRTDEVM